MHIQLAILYTTPDKRRRVRVHNMCVLASNNATIIFRHADLDAVTTYLMKTTVEKALRTPLGGAAETTARNHLHAQLIDILHKYRVQCSSHSPRGQLILPESLKILPLYVLGMLKHPALILNNANDPVSPHTLGTAIGKLNVRGHERAYELRRMLSLPVRETINSLYPRLFAMHSVLDDEEISTSLPGFSAITDRFPVKLPRTVSVTSEVFESDGLYLLDDGSTLWLYVGRNVPQADIAEWFGLYPSQRPSTVTFQPSSEAALKMATVIEVLKFYNPQKQGEFLLMEV